MTLTGACAVSVSYAQLCSVSVRRAHSYWLWPDSPSKPFNRAIVSPRQLTLLRTWVASYDLERSLVQVSCSLRETFAPINLQPVAAVGLCVCVCVFFKTSGLTDAFWIHHELCLHWWLKHICSDGVESKHSVEPVMELVTEHQLMPEGCRAGCAALLWPAWLYIYSIATGNILEETFRLDEVWL